MKRYKVGDKIKIGHWTYLVIDVKEKGYDMNNLSTGVPEFMSIENAHRSY